MKRTSLTLFLLLLFVGGVYAEEDEFPIELTCEIGKQIVYISLNLSTEDNWVSVMDTNVSEWSLPNNYLEKRRGKVKLNQEK